MAHNPSSRKPAARPEDFEYVNRNSARTTPALIFTTLFALGIMVGAYAYWVHLDNWEQGDYTIKMTTLEHALYQLGGKWLSTGLIFATGIVLLVAGILQWRRRTQLRDANISQTAAPVVSIAESRAFLLQRLEKQQRTAAKALIYVTPPALLATIILFYPVLTGTFTSNEQWRLSAGVIAGVITLAPLFYKYEARKVKRIQLFIEQHPDKIVWIFIHRLTYNGAPIESLMLGDNTGVLHKMPLNARKAGDADKTFNAAAQVFPAAILGHSQALMKEYKREPGLFNRK
jgi:hypothetical protein